MMIGISPDETYEMYRQPLDAGSRLYVFSDGVSEIHRPEGV